LIAIPKPLSLIANPRPESNYPDSESTQNAQPDLPIKLLAARNSSPRSGIRHREYQKWRFVLDPLGKNMQSVRAMNRGAASVLSACSGNRAVGFYPQRLKELPTLVAAISCADESESGQGCRDFYHTYLPGSVIVLGFPSFSLHGMFEEVYNS
jgi:hypothetical protein